MYNRVDLWVTIHKPILLGGLVLFNDENKNYEKIRKNTNAPLKFEIRIRIFLSWTPPIHLKGIEIPSDEMKHKKLPVNFARVQICK